VSQVQSQLVAAWPEVMTSNIAWTAAADNLTLDLDDIHVWRVNQDVPISAVKDMAHFLTETENDRAERFVFERDNRRFRATRAILRKLLARYLDCAPEDVHIRKGLQDKPFLDDRINTRQLKFNISHSNGLALMAFSLEGELGIDLEFARPEFATMEIAERFFSKREIEDLRKLTGAEQVRAFYRCWTRKEAYVKAGGGGLQIPLDSFDVSVGTESEVRLRSADCERWYLKSFTPAPSYEACLAMEGKRRIAFLEQEPSFL